MIRHVLNLLCVAFIVTACTSNPGPKQPSTNYFVRLLESKTVALYDVDSPAVPHCTAVWVGPTALLTAGHCIEVGKSLAYSLASEYVGVLEKPKQSHLAHVVKADLDHDLALYMADGEVPAHQTVTVALSLPVVGEKLFFDGHPRGLTWTFRTGTVAAYRESNLEEEWIGPWTQVDASIDLGDSGGGAFNDTGELVGVVHAISASSPSVAFCVHLTTIRTFLSTP